MTPSSLLSLEDPYVAFCMNEAVWELGTFIENKLNEVSGKNDKEVEGKRRLVLKKILEAEGADSLYATPVATM